MTGNLLRETWKDIDSVELMLLLYERIGRPGQYDDISNNPNKFYLPLAGSSCRVALTFRKNRIIAIESGPAFDATEWDRMTGEIEKSILVGPKKVGREYSFSSFRVTGSWRGVRSGVQILPPPDDAPRTSNEAAEHPFILEVPIQASDFCQITNHRRMREHRKLTLAIGILLAGRTSLQLLRHDYFWASIPRDDSASWTDPYVKWVEQYFHAKLGDIVLDELSPPAAERLEEMEPEEYYTKIGHDGKGLRVPADLDESICCYAALSAEKRARFDRATFWMDMAWRQWNASMSASFAALVSSIKSLTERGERHDFDCPVCGGKGKHENPGATKRFRVFLEQYAPGLALSSSRSKMYDVRSRILHGSELMQLDQHRAIVFGWDPPWFNESELYNDLWRLTRVALRNWLKKTQLGS